MMAPRLTWAETERIDRRLWEAVARAPGAKLYAIVDGARNHGVYPWLSECRQPHQSLFDEPMPDVLRSSVPYLVELDRGAAFNLDLIARAFGTSLALYVESTASIDQVRAHLRQFLRVTDERGRRLLFRYWDPRVLRAYLPTCTVSELRDFFGPIACFWVEAPDASAIVSYSCEAGRLVVAPMPVERIGDGLPKGGLLAQS